MDSSAEGSDFFSTSSSHHSFYNGVKDDIIVDLGLSLGTSFHPETYHSPGNLVALRLTMLSYESVVSPVEYGEFMSWPHLKSYMKNSEMAQPVMNPEGCDDENEGVQSSERWVYVKVNMDGVIVGRKVCILDHACYSSLAIQLEDMFGKHSLSGLRLFQIESDFSLFYKDKNDHWRIAGDVPWIDFWNV
ncbi:hypothetical protein IFM89_024465 [Coptis chinensis]|uniref:Auxin-responsive protein n=1 Tax=Coptis chinensis TaxID=261450 RepID=A0A835LFJ0_9MAGN|nr:hypothetical protein IFM89_024465 [Coptis chinensis]